MRDSFTCEFCQCVTNASQRRCCAAGQEFDRRKYNVLGTCQETQTVSSMSMADTAMDVFGHDGKVPHKRCTNPWWKPAVPTMAEIDVQRVRANSMLDAVRMLENKGLIEAASGARADYQRQIDMIGRMLALYHG